VAWIVAVISAGGYFGVVALMAIEFTAMRSFNSSTSRVVGSDGLCNFPVRQYEMRPVIEMH
jgi:hypothetical protein